MFKGIGKVEYAKENPFVSQVVTTSDGQRVEIPQMVGSDTRVIPMEDDMYKVITQGVRLPKPEAKVKILTEAELIRIVQKYGDKTDIRKKVNKIRC